MWGGTSLKLRGQSLYTMPAGTPVGIDKDTGQFAPVVSMNLQAYPGTLHAFPSVSGLCRVSTGTFVALFLTSASSLNVVAFTVSANHEVTYGTATVIGSANLGTLPISDASGICAIANNKFAVVFSNSANSNFQTAVVGTVSGTTITLGSLTVIVSTAGLPKCCSLGTDRFVAMVKTAGSEVGFIACSVSGTTITAGSSVNAVDAGIQVGMRDICEVNTNTFVAGYCSTTAGVLTRAVAGTVSGTTISLGASVMADGGYPPTNWPLRIASAAGGSFLVSYYDSGASYTIRRCAGTVSGNTVTVGTAVTPNSPVTAIHPFALAAISNTSYISIEFVTSPLIVQTTIANVSGTTVLPMSRDTILSWVPPTNGHIAAVCPFRDGMFLFLSPHQASLSFMPVVIAPESVHLRAIGVLETNVTVGGSVNAIIRGIVNNSFSNTHRLPLAFERVTDAAGDVLQTQPATASGDARSIPRRFVWLTTNRIWVNFLL